MVIRKKCLVSHDIDFNTEKLLISSANHIHRRTQKTITDAQKKGKNKENCKIEKGKNGEAVRKFK